MLEKTIEQYLYKKVAQVRGWAIKLASQHHNGLPDRLVIFPGGKVYFVELKQKGQRPRASQIHTHNMIKALGFNVLVIDSKEQVNEFIKTATTA